MSRIRQSRGTMRSLASAGSRIMRPRAGRSLRRGLMRRTLRKLLAEPKRRARMVRRISRLLPRRRQAGVSAPERDRLAMQARRSGKRILPAHLRRLAPRPREAKPTIYAVRGDLEVRLATRSNEVRASQALRYRVFYREMSARASARARFTRRDRDQFDRICDHMLVVDHAAKGRGIPLLRGSRGRVVATYRMLAQDVAIRNGGFYSQDEYDIAPLLSRRSDLRFLELGRSCVLKPYRNKLTIELLWQGVWGYIRERGFDVMIGCASLEGTDPDELATPLSFLYHHALAPEEWRVRAQPHRYVDMNRLPVDQIDMRTAMKNLPPLIKGYLRLGAFVGDGAVVDHQFGTTDVFIVLPRENINVRYFAHFGAPDDPVGVA